MAYMTKQVTTGGTVPIGSNLYGTSNASGVVTMPDFNVLVSGVTIHVRFPSAGTYTALQVGSTASVPISRNGSASSVIEAGAVKSFTYDGSSWVQNDAEDSSASHTYGLSLSGDNLSIVEDGGSASVTLPSGVTYSLSINGHTVTLTGSDGSTYPVTVPDNNTTYTLSINGNTLSLTPSTGTAQTVTLPNTTYSLSKSGNIITLTGSDGSTSSVTDDGTAYGLDISGDTLSIVANGGSSSVTLPTGVTYSLSNSGSTVTLTGSDGTTSSVTVPNDNTTYTLSLNGQDLTLTPSSGTAQTVTLPDDNTTYTMSISSHTITLTPSTGTAQSVTVPDNNTTYTLSISGNTLTLTPSSGTAQNVTLPDDNTTYSLSKSGDTITLTGSDGSTASVTDSNTWQANTSSANGYVTAGSSYPNKVWATNSVGTPAWRDVSSVGYINLPIVKGTGTANTTTSLTAGTPTAIQLTTEVFSQSGDAGVGTLSVAPGAYNAVEFDGNGIFRITASVYFQSKQAATSAYAVYIMVNDTGSGQFSDATELASMYIPVPTGVSRIGTLNVTGTLYLPSVVSGVTIWLVARSIDGTAVVDNDNKATFLEVEQIGVIS